MSDNQKGGVLEGGSLTAEVIESSDNVLTEKGLQQWYSPKEMAHLAARFVGDVATLDPTAGDGMLMSQMAESQRTGIEIDSDQIANAKSDKRGYQAIHGDLQQIAPLLFDMGAKWDALVLNPPFGLKWSDMAYNGNHPVNACRLAYHYASQLLKSDGAGLMVCGGDGKYDNIAEHLVIEAGQYVMCPYLVIHVEDMFEGTQTPADVVFFGWVRTGYDGNFEPPHVQRETMTREDLEAPSTFELIRRLRGERTYYRGWGSVGENKVSLWCRAAQQEHDRLKGKRLARKNDFDLYGMKKMIRVHLRPFTALKLAQTNQRAKHEVEGFDRQPIEYFVLNHKAWDKLLKMQEDETIFVEPALIERVAKMQLERQREIVPMYELKPQQRLAYLEDLEKVLCTTSHTWNGKAFSEGEEYPISVQSVVSQQREKGRPVVNKKTGDITLKDFMTERKMLQIRIAGVLFSETKKDIEHLVEHYDIPDPGTVADRYPEETERNRVLLDSYCIERDWKYKPFQREDLARLLVKGKGLLAWEQGLGKTLAGLTFGKGCVDVWKAREQVLVIVPQDLIPQWKREAKRFFGIELTWLRSGQDFRDCRDHLRKGGTGWYITHYEALSRTGGGKTPKGNVSMLKEETPLGSVRSFVRVREQKTGGDWYHDADGNLQKAPVKVEKVRETVDDGTHCPNCQTSHVHGYNPARGCGKCGWSRYSRRVKPNYDTIKSCFRQGVLVVDELTKMKGDSDRSRAVRGVKAAHVLGMTGTPIKNYIPDSFWGLWKSLGDASPQFPYAYSGGKTKYENDFAVVEFQTDRWGRKEGRKILPEITNVSRLWRLLSSSIVRRRKEETGEKLVKRTFYPTSVPLGVNQRAAAERWLQSFGTFFALKNPNHKLVTKGMHEMMAAMLGQLWKLEFAATQPEADPNADFWVSDEEGNSEYKELVEAFKNYEAAEKVKMEYKEDWLIEPVSNWTPAACRVMELALHHAAKGDRILIGSDIVLPGKFLAEELGKRGVKVGNVLTEGDGDPKTKSPAARAKIVQEFQTGKVSCLIATCEALNLGHNLDEGTVIIINGLPWDYATFDQFIARIHRLTSKKDVKVYVIIPRGTLTERKWKLLVDKGAAAQLALDGRLIEADEEHIDQATILKQLIEAGVPVSGTEVEEAELQKQWEKIKSAEDIGEIVLDGIAVEDLHELTEEEEEAMQGELEERELDGDTREPIVEPEPEPEVAEPHRDHHCYVCKQGMWASDVWATDTDGDTYCSQACWEHIFGDQEPEEHLRGPAYTMKEPIEIVDELPVEDEGAEPDLGSYRDPNSKAYVEPMGNVPQPTRQHPCVECGSVEHGLPEDDMFCPECLDAEDEVQEEITEPIEVPEEVADATSDPVVPVEPEYGAEAVEALHESPLIEALKDEPVVAIPPQDTTSDQSSAGGLGWF